MENPKVAIPGSVIKRQITSFEERISSKNFPGPIKAEQPCHLVCKSLQEVWIGLTICLPGEDEAHDLVLSLDPGTLRALRKAINILDESGMLGEGTAEPTPH